MSMLGSDAISPSARKATGKRVTSHRAVRIVFLLEMAFSPVVAAVAFLAPVVAHWGAYKYVPAIVWSAIFVQCLVTFRWRGLWFMAGLPVAFFGIEIVLVAAPPVPNKEAQAREATSSGSVTGSPMIIRNPDGTFTIRKQPPKGTTEADQQQGLTIPPQVVVPFVRLPANK